MKKTFFIFFFIFVCNSLFGQSKQAFLSDSTSNIISLLSYYWKLDSLANNGFRLFAYDRILKSKVDTAGQTFIIDKLGKPNEIKRTNQGIQLVYNFYDEKAIPHLSAKPFSCNYIYLLVDERIGILKTIGDGVKDY